MKQDQSPATVMYKTLPDGDLVACFAFLIAGLLAIVASMVCHDRWMG
ncbi:MAG: hypothetical protein R8M38_02745 [Mariprofundaceae bacterium]